MNPSEQLIALANSLEDPDHTALIAAEKSEECLDIVAEALAHAAEVLKIAAEQIELTAPAEPLITEQTLEEMAALAESFAESEDPLLMKQADVLDQLLITFADHGSLLAEAKKVESDRLDQLKKKYHEMREKQREMDGIEKQEKEMEKSPMYKQYRSLEAPLSTRTCPQHFCPLHRVGENLYQCALSGETYDWEQGYTTERGNKIPGGSVQGQGNVSNDREWSTFNSEDSRATRSGFNQ